MKYPDLAHKYPYVPTEKRFRTFLTKEKIFWGNSTDNLPNRTFIMPYLNHNLIGGDVVTTLQTPNYLSQTNATMVVDSDIYQLCCVYDTKQQELTIYIVKSISRKWQNGYELELVLDIWLTYGIDVFTELEMIEKVGVERISNIKPLLNNNTITLGKLYNNPDELLANAPFYLERSATMVENIPLTQIGGNMLCNWGVVNPVPEYTNLYAVFTSTNLKILLVPIFSEQTQYRIQIISKPEIAIVNTRNHIQQVINNNIQDFKGIYLGPAITKFSKTNIFAGTMPTKTPDPNKYLYFEFPPDNGCDVDFEFKFDKFSMLDYDLNLDTYYSPTEKVSNVYIFFLQNVYAFNSDNRLNKFINYIPHTNRVVSSMHFGKMIFSNGLYLTTSKLCSTPLNISNDNSIITFSSQLPAMVDMYQSYINANKNSLNTSMNTLRQNHNFNLITNMMSGGMNVGQSILGGISKGDPVGAATGGISSVMNMAFSAAQNGMSYAQSMKAIKASYADKKTSSPNQLIDSTISDIQKSISLINKIFYDPNTGILTELTLGWNQKLFVEQATYETITNWNRLLFLYGYKYDGFVSGLQLETLRNFNYIKIADDFIITNFTTICQKLNYSNDIIALVCQLYSDGFRLCRVTPDYATDPTLQIQVA